MKYFYLQGRKLIRAKSMLHAAQKAALQNRQVALSTVGEYRISTVFLMLDHNMEDTGPPLVFETMVFDSTGRAGEEIGPWMQRYSTYQRALDGHNHTVDEIRAYVAQAKTTADTIITQTSKEDINHD